MVVLGVTLISKSTGTGVRSGLRERTRSKARSRTRLLFISADWVPRKLLNSSAKPEPVPVEVVILMFMIIRPREKYLGGAFQTHTPASPKPRRRLISNTHHRLRSRFK